MPAIFQKLGIAFYWGSCRITSHIRTKAPHIKIYTKCNVVYCTAITVCIFYDMIIK